MPLGFGHIPSSPVSSPDHERQEAFGRAAFVHLDAMCRFARRLTGGDAAHAEDLVQEAFLQAWRSFDRFAQGTNCRAWLYRILFHIWSHEQRRQNRQPLVFDSEAIDREPLLYDPPPPAELTAEEVLSAFANIPKPFQLVVLLADVEELTYREISEALEIPVGTVMSRLSRGRSLLRSALASYARDMGIGRRKWNQSGGE
jgi:RNA polymerase sigma-70 factor (ECF subfamily)